MNCPGEEAVGLGSMLSTTYDLTDFATRDDTSWDLNLTKEGGVISGGDTLKISNYKGAKPRGLSRFAATALNDGICLKRRGSVNLDFTKLAGSTRYELLIYSARGNGGGGAKFTFTTGSGKGGTIKSTAANDDEFLTLTAASTAEGELTLTWTHSNGELPSALNFISITKLQ